MNKGQLSEKFFENKTLFNIMIEREEKVIEIGKILDRSEYFSLGNIICVRKDCIVNTYIV